MSNSAQFEHEAERTRAHLHDTVAELRSRLTVGQVADQLWDLAKDGLGGDFARNLARQAANNPMPVALAGTGLAWLMFAKSTPGAEKSPSPSRRVDTAPRAGDGLGVSDDEMAPSHDSSSHPLRSVKNAVNRTAHDLRDAAEATGATIVEGVESVAEGASEAASAAYSTVRKAADTAKSTAATAYEGIKQRAASAQNTAGSAYEQVKESAMQAKEMARTSAEAVGDYATGTAQRVTDFCVENPLVLIGAGIALGAIAGAVLPTTEVENELMGETSDEIKQQAEHVAAAQVEKVQRVGEQVVNHIVESATQEFSPDDVGAEIESGRPDTTQSGNTAVP
jgi:hypothetical protein